MRTRQPPAAGGGAGVRSQAEHPDPTLKRLRGLAQFRYRGLANANRAVAMRAMLDVSKWGRPPTGEVRPA